ncbi:MAG: TIM barrel protein [Symbiobacteriia bacterium]
MPLRGGFGPLAGSGRNEQGEDLEWPAWQGAEIGFHDTYGDVLGAVPEAEARDWNIGVHHPLYQGYLPPWLPFLDPDAAVRQAALEQAAAAADSAHGVGGRYIVFHYPWPALLEPGREYPGWRLLDRPGSLADWTAKQVYDVSRKAFDHLANLQEQAHIRIALEIDGPNRYFYEDDLYTRLLTEFPTLSLCQDTGRLMILAETHGFDPLAMSRRWHPWTRYVHLHSGRWLPDGRFQVHLPTLPEDPEAEIARGVVAAQPKTVVVLEHDIRLVTKEHSERSHRFAAELAGVRLT